ncbi:MAG TPA: helix-turn-helix transcriptional regulator [Candidatus Dormibacteraeota bacterium]|nr:helix-turn-helix transcriptional regulator [Candidatus Dormibacteraeota bacterium]
MPRPPSDSPQLLTWAENAGSDEKRCLAALALRRGLTPTTLAKAIGLNAGWLGRWFMRRGNGAGRTLRDICKALRVSPADPFTLYERALLDLIRTEGKRHFSNAPALARRVVRELGSKRRARILGDYALARAKQEQALVQSLATIKPRRNLSEPWTEPPDAFDACLVAIKQLRIPTPVRPNQHRPRLILALFDYVQAIRAFTGYGKSESLFDAEQCLGPILEVLRKGDWPEDLLDEAEPEVRKLCDLPQKGKKT